MVTFFDSDDAKAPSGRFFGLRQSVFSVFKITNLITTDKFSTKKTHNNGINNSYERQ
jgi:hypothetical protein